MSETSDYVLHLQQLRDKTIALQEYVAEAIRQRDLQLAELSELRHALGECAYAPAYICRCPLYYPAKRQSARYNNSPRYCFLNGHSPLRAPQERRLPDPFRDAGLYACHSSVRACLEPLSLGRDAKRARERLSIFPTLSCSSHGSGQTSTAVCISSPIVSSAKGVTRARHKSGTLSCKLGGRAKQSTHETSAYAPSLRLLEEVCSARSFVPRFYGDCHVLLAHLFVEVHREVMIRTARAERGDALAVLYEMPSWFLIQKRLRVLVLPEVLRCCDQELMENTYVRRYKTIWGRALPHPAKLEPLLRLKAFIALHSDVFQLNDSFTLMEMLALVLGIVDSAEFEAKRLRYLCVKDLWQVPSPQTTALGPP